MISVICQHSEQEEEEDKIHAQRHVTYEMAVTLQLSARIDGGKGRIWRGGRRGAELASVAFTT